MRQMRNFFIVTRTLDPRNQDLIREMEAEIRENGGTVSHTLYVEDPKSSSPVRLPFPDHTQCVFSIGGDGTLVRAAQSIGEREYPLIGINHGHLGYLCELDDSTVYSSVHRLMEGDYEIESRMMLMGNLEGNENPPLHALNDIVITAAGGLNLINLTVYINGKLLYTYNCDGMILSTPTGSTAYNLSANGPLVDPKTRVILLNPLNAHTLNSRALVLDADDELTVELGARHEDMRETATVAFDGFHRMQMERGDRIFVRRSDRVTRMIRMSKLNFLERISKKMQEV